MRLVGAAVGAREFLVELLVEGVLALEQLHDEYVLSVDDLHHFGGHAQVAGVYCREVGLGGLQLAEGRVSLEILGVFVQHFGRTNQIGSKL